MQLRFDAAGGALEGFPIDFEALARLMGPFLESRGLGGYGTVSVSLSLAGEDEIRGLNARYREIDEPTDVLSFPLWEEEGRFVPPEGWAELPLGDVVVSPSFVRENAKTGEVDYNREIVLVVVHGVLHLIGYDHDAEERRLEMWAAQDELVEAYEDLRPWAPPTPGRGQCPLHPI